MITPEEVGKWSTVSDEEARKLYDERKDKMGTPDRREVSQIVFPNMSAPGQTVGVAPPRQRAPRTATRPQ